MTIGTPPNAYKIDELNQSQVQFVKDSLSLTGLDVYDLIFDTTVNKTTISLDDSFNYKFTNDTVLVDLDIIEDIDGTQYPITIRNTSTIPAGSIFDVRIQGSNASLYYYDILPLGTFIGKFGSFGTADGEFNSNLGLVINNDRLYSSSRARQDIQEFDLSGNFITKFGTHTYSKITTDGTNLYATRGGDFSPPVGVEIFDLSGSSIGSFGSDGTADGEFTYPFGIAVLNNKLYVGDFIQDRVQIFQTNGTFVSKFGSTGSGDGQFQQITGMCSNGVNLFVCDSGRSDVQIFNSSGVFVSKFGSNGSGNGQFLAVQDICVYNNKLVVTDQSRDDVQIFEFDGTFVGKFGSNGSLDGEFQDPIGIAANTTSIYVIDVTRSDVQIFK